MKITPFNIEPGAENATPAARIARLFYRNGNSMVDRCYAAFIHTIEPDHRTLYYDDGFTELAAAMDRWIQQHHIDAVVMEKHREVYFARDEDRTMFILHWMSVNSPC